MVRVTKIIYKGKEIIKVDYSNAKEDEMMEILTCANDMIVKEKNDGLVLSIFNENNFVTQKFMRHVEKTLPQSERQIKKNAITGLSQAQIWILKGINLWSNKKIYPFQSEADALDFLTENL